MDRAGLHIARRLDWPDTVTPLHLPPYSPELNPIERVWLYLRERFLSHRLFDTYDAIIAACCDAWNDLIAEARRIASLGSCALTINPSRERYQIDGPSTADASALTCRS